MPRMPSGVDPAPAADPARRRGALDDLEDVHDRIIERARHLDGSRQPRAPADAHVPRAVDREARVPTQDPRKDVTEQPFAMPPLSKRRPGGQRDGAGGRGRRGPSPQCAPVLGPAALRAACEAQGQLERRPARRRSAAGSRLAPAPPTSVASTSPPLHCAASTDRRHQARHHRAHRDRPGEGPRSAPRARWPPRSARTASSHSSSRRRAERSGPARGSGGSVAHHDHAHAPAEAGEGLDRSQGRARAKTVISAGHVAIATITPTATA